VGTVTGKVEGTRTDVGSVTGKAEGAGTDDEGTEVMDTDTGTIVDAMEDVGCAVTAVETVTGTVVGVEVGIVGILSPGLVPNSYTLNFSDPIPPDLLLNGTLIFWIVHPEVENCSPFSCLVCESLVIVMSGCITQRPLSESIS
jgi:hypothetical protein